mmetsp:Transcript_6541/g.17692  ORF Transcript_6541/g.17692 Transcript_6541/m.17692 type:complete len:289 (-) Transcript_6541:56-922(-)|eukprot:CAMPEP_0171191002 /NCGR_PEP_ID=MMETSP0790-20130122/19142_1 /TAXON_ID=2925 /ORGANISM="Alexandrium catenella, Strain OF101" /LENGTH=288 /DNA_ID=CAMNT_0011656141 /DNA_START=108 /DNA_END=974 /DNA_ORIENTATION=+
MAYRRQLQGEAYATSRPGQDEKLAIYRKHHGLMDSAFDRGREFRKSVQNEYDDRNGEIVEKLDAIKQRTDGEVQRQQDRMNEFSSEFDESLLRRRREWDGKLTAERGEVSRQSESIAENIGGFEKLIAEEREACLADTASETEPLLEALRQHKERLQQQAVGREDRHAEFRKALSSEFGRLRKRLDQEAATRKKQCEETSCEVKRRYADLSKRLCQQDDKARERLLDLRVRLESEQTKRRTVHRSVVESFTAFVADLEKHVAEGQRMMEAMRGTLVSMQSKLRSNEPP